MEMTFSKKDKVNYFLPVPVEDECEVETEEEPRSTKWLICINLH